MLAQMTEVLQHAVLLQVGLELAIHLCPPKILILPKSLQPSFSLPCCVAAFWQFLQGSLPKGLVVKPTEERLQVLPDLGCLLAPWPLAFATLLLVTPPLRCFCQPNALTRLRLLLLMP